MPLREELAIEIGPRRIRALTAVRRRGGLRVTRALVEHVPASIGADDAGALGRWAGGRLEAAGFPRGRATIALSREHVSLKRLELPTADANDLPDMIRLALRRDMPFDAERAVIDFVVVARDEARTTVLAVAAPAEVIARARAVAGAAGLRATRIGLRAMGSAMLLRTLESHREICALVVDITACAVELCVVERGSIRFSRAASLAPPDADDPARAAAPLIEAVVTETRRSWMSYRITEDASDVARVVLVGDPEVTAGAALPIGTMLNAEAEVIDRHPLVASDGAVLDRVWPLAGMLLETAQGAETIDFAHPRRSVDRAAARRRRAVIAAGLLVVVALGLWTAGRRHVARLEARLEALEQRLADVEPRLQRYQRDVLTLSHLERWAAVDVGWLDHVRALREVLPPPREAVLDGWAGTLDFRGVRYDRRERTWSAPLELSIVVDGEARDRATADALREALVRGARYRTTSSGADARGGRRLPHGFTYRLTTHETTPPAAPDGNPAARAAMRGGGEE